MRWVAVGVCVGAIAGCGGASRLLPAPVVQTSDAGRDAGPPPSDASLPPPVERDAAADATPLCPPPLPPPATPPGDKAGWGTPTNVPFSCDPLPNAFIFPPPGADTPGVYARCASFTDARATSLAINGDGSRVALIGTDGVGRIVDVASRMVIGVLAPPRASIGRAAFSPAGDTILTVAEGERLVTLWRADAFTPVWTTSLPGHAYQGYDGSAAFSPDGTAAVVSTGAGLYLLDTASGAIQATGDIRDDILNVAYGWNGRRIAVLHAPLTGMCLYSPHGGAVTLLDAKTLAPIATPVAWALTGDESPPPGNMAVAANADLLVTTQGAYPYSGLSAFRLSDGGSLPAPGFTGFPMLLTPDGTAGLIARDGALRLERLADGALVAATMAPLPMAAAISGDGSAIAAGSAGPDLLAVWRPAVGSWTPTCSAERPVKSGGTLPTALDASGATVAVGWGPEIRLLRRADGALLSTFDHAHQASNMLILSPDARYLLGRFVADPPTGLDPIAVLRTSDGLPVADLRGMYPYSDGAWQDFRFLPGKDQLDATLTMGGSRSLVQFDLESGAATPDPYLDGPVQGLSGDCPLVAGPNLTLYRECGGGCAPVALATNTRGGLVSMDGRFYLTEDAANGPHSTVLWNITSPPTIIGTYPPRPEEATWAVDEIPVAIGADGSRVITTAWPGYYTCTNGAPGFTARVHDVATNATIDDLPPHMTAFSGNLGVISYGPVLWCAR
jgi:hypothetical protein